MASNNIARTATALLTVLCFLDCWEVQEVLITFDLGWGSHIITFPCLNHHARHDQHRYLGCRGSPGTEPAPAPTNAKMTDRFSQEELNHERQCHYPQPPDCDQWAFYATRDVRPSPAAAEIAATAILLPPKIVVVIATITSRSSGPAPPQPCPKTSSTLASSIFLLLLLLLLLSLLPPSPAPPPGATTTSRPRGAY
ncbi:hypothetical protein INS49_013611 [Diaporthe citri]|uniref:uncharacterized protein n=1 Tax=Diaporthe citri TaxID=83186 RepID=UPI001C7E9434|nr:uncharacterized protein INS49_013611 [Diaporthe citri]KAG6357732.1 hypothetical protein INS49_013611 [Diaporthe citri]